MENASSHGPALLKNEHLKEYSSLSMLFHLLRHLISWPNIVSGARAYLATQETLRECWTLHGYDSRVTGLPRQPHELKHDSFALRVTTVSKLI
jgi:hypothetical protein